MRGRGNRMIARRHFIAALSASTLAMPLHVLAQQIPAKTRRIGILLFNSPQIDPIGPLLQGLQTLGYTDGKTVVIDYRFADGKFERLPSLAAELVSLRPDVIFAYGGDVAPHAKKATSSIPIVAMVSNDPVQSGLIASMRRPGENVTGVTMIYDELSGKLVELLKEAVPTISRVSRNTTRLLKVGRDAAIARSADSGRLRRSVRCCASRTCRRAYYCVGATSAAAAAADCRIW